MTGVALVTALLSLGYVFLGLWTSTGDAAAFIASERRGITYIRPLTGLLAALVDAQSAAVVGKTVDAAAVRAAVEDVNHVDGQLGSSLGIGQRWSKLPGKIESALNAKAIGQDALRTYAVPVALTQALLGEVGDLAKVVRDPELDAFHLVDAALFRVPEVIVNTGELAAVAHARERGQASGRDQRLAVAQDRLVRAAEAISAGLRMGVDASAGDTIDLDLLDPLDEFAAAVDGLAKTAAALGGSGTSSADVEAARVGAHKAAVALESAMLAALDTSLQARANELAEQRRYAVLAGLLAGLATVAVLWLRPPDAGTAPVSSVPARLAAGRHYGYPPDGSGADGESSGDLIDARELHDLVGAGQTRANRRRAR